jgi:hypothetical protein
VHSNSFDHLVSNLTLCDQGVSTEIVRYLSLPELPRSTNNNESKYQLLLHTSALSQDIFQQNTFQPHGVIISGVIFGYMLNVKTHGRKNSYLLTRCQEDFSSIPCVQIGSGAHPASYPMSTGGPFPWVKRGRGVTLTTHPHPAPMLIMSRSYTSSPPV